MGTVTDWRDALVGAMGELNRWIQGRYVPEPDAADEIQPSSRYLDLDFLKAAIRRSQSTSLHVRQTVAGYDVPKLDDHEDTDIRIAISTFARVYPSSITSVALTALGCGVGLDLSTARCRMVVRHNLPMRVTVDFSGAEIVTCAERSTTWAVPATRSVATLDELRLFVWRRLYAGHLAPLMARLKEISKVSDHLVWSNCAEWVGMVSDGASEYLPADRARPFVEDRTALLNAAELPGIDGANPMHGLLEWLPMQAPELPDGLQTRRVCCLVYMAPQRYGRLCQNCSLLSPEDRIALIRERHGLAQGTAGGPAERRAIEVGLQKLGHTRREGA